MGTCTSEEGRSIIKNVLLAIESGLGRHEISYFPVAIFKLKEGVNYNPGDKNYDLFKLAERVSAKRLFPTFSNLDAPFNAQYYVEGRPETEVAYMGCVDGREFISYKINGVHFINSFETAYNMILELGQQQSYSENSKYIDTSDMNVEIYDTLSGGFVKVKKFIRNANVTNWVELRLDTNRVLLATTDHPLPVKGKGRTFVKDIEVGDIIPITDAVGTRVSLEKDAKYRDIAYKLGKHLEFNDDLYEVSRETKLEFLAGMLERCLVFKRSEDDAFVKGKMTKKVKAYKLLYFINSLGYACKIMRVGRADNVYDDSIFEVDFYIGEEVLEHIRGKDRADYYKICVSDKQYSGDTEVKKIITVERVADSYDVETESDTFDVSGICSHNCRTRVIGNVHDPEREITVGRGNLSFTTINLPRLGILAEHDMNKFYDMLDAKLELVKDQLLDRFKIQCKKHVYNYPMLMGQGEWIDSDKLSQNDSVAEVLKHGSLSIGYIGLAECLTALIGKHHGESEEAQRLGLEIIKHMRDYLDKVSETMKLNFGLLGTPKICGHLCRNV